MLRFVRMKAQKTTIRVIRAKLFRAKERPIEAKLDIGGSHTKYKVPLDAGKHASVLVYTARLDNFQLITWRSFSH